MAATATPETLLRDASLRVTDCRVAVLDAFLTRGYALSHAELEHELAQFDRVTLYRTLGTYEEKGLLHRVPDPNGVAKYALCASGCVQDHHHHDDHVHFQCTRCGRTECLDHVRVPALTLPAGYQVTDVTLLVQGTCKSCAS